MLIDYLWLHFSICSFIVLVIFLLIVVVVLVIDDNYAVTYTFFLVFFIAIIFLALSTIFSVWSFIVFQWIDVKQSLFSHVILCLNESHHGIFIRSIDTVY